MTLDKKSSDASYYFQSSSTSDIARLDTSSVAGNLSDLMRNATVLFASNLPVPQSAVLLPDMEVD